MKKSAQKYWFNNQGGATPIMLLFAAIGVVVFLIFTNTLSFKDRLFDKLFPKPPSSASVGVPDTVEGNSRGYTITPQELRAIKQKADQGIEPYKTNVNNLLTDSRYAANPTAWPHGTISGVITESGELCGGEESGPVYLESGGPMVYAKALAYHLTGNAQYASVARSKILDLIDTSGYGDNVSNPYGGGNNCILGLAWGVPEFILAADLLEDYSGWTTADKLSFQTWLANVVYKKVAWASRARVSNWGAGGSYTAAMIADYLHDSGLNLVEVQPAAKTLTPAQAYLDHNQMQKDRMNTTWVGDSLCTIHGIQSHGGIPDELRRGSTGCTGQFLLSQDLSWTYMATYLEGTAAHAEFLLRRGDRSLYDNLNGNGTGSLKKAVMFVINNPIDSSHSFDWVKAKKSPLHIINRYYKDNSIKQRLNNSSDPYLEAGNVSPFGKLTHDYASTENPGLPPTVPPINQPIATPNPTPTPDSGATLSISGVTLVSAANDTDINQLENGNSIDLAIATQASFKANTNPAPIGSVKFELTKPNGTVDTKVESELPYVMFGDGNNGLDYYPWTPAPVVGSYTLRLTPYSGSGASGTTGTQLTINFSVTDGTQPTPTPTPTPSPVADNANPTVSITDPLNGATVTRGSTYTIKADATDDSGIAKVEFFINSSTTPYCIELAVPYECRWTVSGKRDRTHTINVKATDIVGKSSTTSVSVTAK